MNKTGLIAGFASRSVFDEVIINENYSHLQIKSQISLISTFRPKNANAMPDRQMQSVMAWKTAIRVSDLKRVAQFSDSGYAANPA